MTRTVTAALALVVSIGWAPPRQANVHDAQLETETGAIADVVASLGRVPDPAWVAWQVPMVAGDRDRCGGWSDAVSTVRGAWLESGDRPVVPPMPGTRSVSLEADTSLVVLLRIVDGRVERVRSVVGDCPIDAGGRRVIWLSAVTAAESVRFLNTLAMAPTAPGDGPARVANSALATLALHDDESADAALDAHLAPGRPDALRRLATTWFAEARGRKGLDRLVGLATTADDVSLRRMAAGALWRSPEPTAVGVLWQVAETAAGADVRAEALAGYAMVAPDADLDRLVGRLDREDDPAVRRRGIQGLGRRSTPVTTAILIRLARTTTDRALRTEAVRALSRSSDPAAIRYLEELLQ